MADQPGDIVRLRNYTHHFPGGSVSVSYRPPGPTRGADRQVAVCILLGFEPLSAGGDGLDPIEALARLGFVPEAAEAAEVTGRPAFGA